MDKYLVDGRTVWREQIDEVLFEERMRGQFPELAPALRNHAGLMHLRMATIAEALMKRIAGGQIERAIAMLVLIDQLFAAGKPASAVENALQISFVTAADLMATAAGRAVLAGAPERIRQILTGAP
jgi:hypothetical protein